MIHNDEGYLVKIPWYQGDTMRKWNDTCALAIEKFGLPGQKFRAISTRESINFYFKEEKDAVWFLLLCE